MNQLQMTFRTTRWEGGDGDGFHSKELRIMGTHFSIDHIMTLLHLSSEHIFNQIIYSQDHI